MNTINLKVALGVTCALILAGGPATTISSARTMPAMLGENVYLGNSEVPHPIMIWVTGYFLDVAHNDFDTASKQIASGPQHDTELLNALREGSAKYKEGPTVCTYDHVGPGIIGSFEYPYAGAMYFKTDMATHAKTHVNTDGSITATVSLKNDAPDSTIPPTIPPAIERSLTATRTFTDGQTPILGDMVPVNANDPLIHLAFVKVWVLPNDLSNTAASIPGAPLTPMYTGMARDFQRTGMMSSDDRLRVEGIGLRLAGLRYLSKPTPDLPDDEYDFLLAVLKKPSKEPGLMISDVFGVFEELTNIPIARKEQIFQAALPFLKVKGAGPGDSLCRGSAMGMLTKLGDKKAISYLLPLLNDPEPRLRALATKDLKRLGYSAPTDASR